MEQYLRVGVFSSTHGVKGEIKVFPTTDDLNRFQKMKTVLMDTGKEKIELEIESVKFFKQFAILKFKGYDSINDIEKYKGKEFYVTRENASKLKKNEYYIADMIGLRVVLEDGTEFGVLKEVMQTGANDVYIVEHEGEEVLLPAIRECILNVDIDNAKMTIHLMEGLLD